MTHVYTLIVLSMALFSIAALLLQQTLFVRHAKDHLPFWIVFSRFVCTRIEQQNIKLLLDRKQAKYYATLLVRAGMSPHIKSCDIMTLKYFSSFMMIMITTGLYFFILTNVELYISLSLLLIIVFFNLPDIWLKRKVITRREKFIQLFPFFLDLIVLSIKAGLTFSASIENAVKKIPSGPLQAEFRQVLFDIKTGMGRGQALVLLSQRVDILSVTNFVCVVNQLEVSGGEMGTVLSVQAKHARTERFLKAEKTANQAPVKLLLPLIGLLFPVTLLLILLPVYIRSKESGVFNLLF